MQNKIYPRVEKFLIVNIKNMMYAELAGMSNRKNIGIKSLMDNKMQGRP